MKMRVSVVVVGRDAGSLELARGCLGHDDSFTLAAVDSATRLLASAVRPDVIVIDASAPGTDWSRTVAALRGDRRLSMTPIVVVVPPLLREIERFLHLGGVSVVSRAAARFDLAARIHALLGPDEDYTQPSTPTARRHTSGGGTGPGGLDLAAQHTPPPF